MKNFSALLMFAAASVAGCAGMQSATAPPLQSGPANVQAPSHVRSWMDPGAKSGDLLYVANANHTVTIYSYPKGKLVGTLSGFETPYGLCTDKSQNVYITDYSAQDITVFAHGGTKPVRTIKDSVYLPQGCSIDPTTGNLALANYETFWDYPGNLSIFHKAKGYPQIFQVYEFYYYYFAGYDGSGNAYVDGLFSIEGENFQFAQLRKRGHNLKQMRLPANIGVPGSIVWDGTYLAVGDQTAPNIYEFSIAKGTATLQNTTALSGAGQIVGFTIDGATLVAANQTNSGSSVLFYNYPAGGSPTLTITNGVDFPRDVVVSLGSSKQ